MNREEQNRQAIEFSGQLIENLYEEVGVVPISGRARSALMSVMISKIFVQVGANIKIYLPSPLDKKQ